MNGMYIVFILAGVLTVLAFALIAVFQAKDNKEYRAKAAQSPQAQAGTEDSGGKGEEKPKDKKSGFQALVLLSSFAASVMLCVALTLSAVDGWRLGFILYYVLIVASVTFLPLLGGTLLVGSDEANDKVKQQKEEKLSENGVNKPSSGKKRRPFSAVLGLLCLVIALFVGTLVFNAYIGSVNYKNNSELITPVAQKAFSASSGGDAPQSKADYIIVRKTDEGIKLLDGSINGKSCKKAWTADDIKAIDIIAAADSEFKTEAYGYKSSNAPVKKASFESVTISCVNAETDSVFKTGEIINEPPEEIKENSSGVKVKDDEIVKKALALLEK